MCNKSSAMCSSHASTENISQGKVVVKVSSKKKFLSETHPDVAAQFVENLTNPGKSPEKLTVSSGDKCKWRCPDSENHVWESVVHNRTKGRGCPYCSGRKVLTGDNDLKTKNPDLAAQFVENLTNPGKSPEQLAEGSDNRCKWRCPDNENHVWEAIVSHRTNGSGCPKCSCSGPSQKEQDLANRLTEAISGRTPMRTSVRNVINSEIDIFFPDKNIGIEFNGLFWHSEEQGKDKNYHLDKTLQCKEKGISLIHVWEDEWNARPDAVTNWILNELGFSGEKPVETGDMTIKFVTQKQARKFLENNHIKGFVKSDYYIGDFYENVLRVVLVVKKVSDAGLWSIERYSHLGCSAEVLGELLKQTEKLLAQNKETIKKWEVFSDTCISGDTLYENNGFIKKKEIEPDFTYVKGKERIPKTENIKNGNKIWDCGKVRWVKKT